MKSMIRPKIWHEAVRFFNSRKRSGGLWQMFFTAAVLFLACLAIGILLHLLIDAFSADTVAGMRL